MDITLIVNAGSSSLKLQLFNQEAESFWKSSINWSPQTQTIGDLQKLFAEQLTKELGAPIAINQINAVGHRIVHGGDNFNGAVVIDARVKTELLQLRRLAPLHNGAALNVIEALELLLPGVWQAAAFDTSFHRNLPVEASTYALPLEWRERGLHRFGFHGLSHGAIARRFPKHKLISAHLGAGCSLAVIKNGRCIDTTMGYTPLDGLVMASRSGSVDPGILLELLAQGVTAAELEEGLQKRSGLLGLSGRSGDMQELRQLAMAGNADANLAIAVFQQQLLKAIGAGFALLGGLDVLALTGGIGEHDQVLRQWLRGRLQLLGTAQIAIISANEELEIYQQITALR
ncbi:acetate/propionate family kinase [Synechococcus lacustris]|uniref:acetate/propionate family kinase n=1 Tax=Synechococcus lacustris TaxID=2116544 RepID=UPI0020CE053D|nr:acetate kinase [Synechococcus lacustris]MCP9795127.1 acetate kinase [Synechococcus lacustris L1F-Slac]